MNTWFTSDEHLDHPVMAHGRGFDTVEEMNEAVIQMHNAVVKPKDTVYCLGDFGLRSKLTKLGRLRHRLNGKIHLIVGNHDIANRVQKQSWWSSVQQYTTLKLNKKRIFLCHFPMRCWDRSHYNSWHLYGHVHTGLNFSEPYINGKTLDVGVDYWGRPLEFEEICKIMDKLPDNNNLIRRDK